MASPQLPVPLEHRILKWFCGLPRAARGLILGKPVRSEGQTLARDIQALLWLARLNGIHDLYAGKTAPEARQLSRRGTAVVDGPRRLPLAHVEERQIPGPAGTLPARLYVPESQPPTSPAPLLLYFHGGGFV